MKKKYELLNEDKILVEWLKDKSKQGINISKLEKTAGIPHKVLSRFISGERKQLGLYRNKLVRHISLHFYYENYCNVYNKDKF